MTPSSSLPHATDAPSRTPFPSPSPSPEAAGDGGSRTGVREDLRGYADLGGFTLRADTHAWYAALETIATPEEARAASTVLAELRGRDLPALREGAASLAAGTALDEPGTVEETRRAVTLLLQVRETLAVLDSAAYAEDDLDALVAATASGAWRKEQGVKLPWSQRRSLRRRAKSLTAGRRARREALHTALAAVARQRAEWEALVPGSGLPTLPEDSAFLEETARAGEAAATGLRELGRLLSLERDLETAPFEEVAGLLKRLAADEGTLHRLPNLRSLRDRLAGHDLADLLTELTARRADGAEAVAAYDALRGAEADEEAGAEAEAGEEAAPAAPEETAPVAEAAAEEPAPVAAEEPAAVVEEPVAAEEPAPAAEETAPVVDEPAAAEAPAAATPTVPQQSGPADEAPVAEEASIEEAPIGEAPVAEEPAAVVEERAEAAAEASAPAEEPAPVAAEEEPVVADEPVAVVDEPVAAEEPVTAEAPAEEPAEEPVTAEAPADEPVEEAAPVKVPRARRPKKPSITPGRPVTAYSAQELVAVVRWLDGDGTQRSDDELLRAAMKELGFARLGPRIKEALGAAVAEVRG